MPVKMKAIKAIKYAGIRLVVGTEFDARGKQDARLLEAIGHAVRCPEFQAVPVAAIPFIRAPKVKVERVSVVHATRVEVEPVIEPTPTEMATESAKIESVETVEEPKVPADPAIESEKPKRNYQRRDMTAKKE